MENLQEANVFLKDWPDTYGSPKVPQLLFQTNGEPKQKKPSEASIECDAVSLIQEMKDN